MDLINSLSKEEIQSIKDAGFKKNKELNSLEAFGRSVEYVYKKREETTGELTIKTLVQEKNGKVIIEFTDGKKVK